MKYSHIGIPTTISKPGEKYLEDLDIYCTDHESNPYGIQWMRYGKNCSLPGIVQEAAHIAFEVENLEKALEGKEILIHPNSPSEGVMVAFILEDGTPVVLLEYKGGYAELNRPVQAVGSQTGERNRDAAEPGRGSEWTILSKHGEA
ncbi:MAG: hypothetical protein JXA25_08625 [Anaerolineales bacterium]|nr:hypothetical protein [Anaerolineales bacterium]